MAFRLSGVSDSALAFPPFSPPEATKRNGGGILGLLWFKRLSGGLLDYGECDFVRVLRSVTSAA